MKNKKLLILFSTVCVLSMILASCNFPLNSQTATANSTVTSASVVVPTDVYAEAFAAYQEPTVTLPDEFVGGYTLPLDLGQVNNLSEFPFTDTQLNALGQNGFFVTPPSTDPNAMYTEFYQAYESQRYEQTPLFVTTDSVFHVYHLVFDKMLRDLETTYFIPTLKEFTLTMVDATEKQYQSLKGSDLENAALRNVAFFSIAASLQGLEYTALPAAQTYVDAELALINAHEGTNVSPLWLRDDQTQDLQLIEDYSQYIPRGHYTRSAELRNYFKAMMWYGRLTFRLKDEFETQRALLVTQAIRTASSGSGNSALSLWQLIYDPTVFIVGKADDLGIYEYGKLSDAVFGADAQPSVFADKARLEKFIAEARNLPAPQINSMWVWIWQDRDDVTQGFRVMGQRFTLDEYVFGQVMWRNVGTLEKPRDLPKALDFFASMGSNEALNILHDIGESDYVNYDSQLNKVTQEVSDLQIDSWTQNLYWTWLYSLQPLITEKGKQYPSFMQTDAWTRKELATALGSWTELKHDTILYSKQVMAEMGGGPSENPPHGYVEPNPYAYARLIALVQMTRSGLENRNLLDETTQANLDNLVDELNFLLDISQRELNGGTITDDEYWRIQYYGGWLEAITIASADSESEEPGRNYLEDQKSAVVADVATGMGRVLEEGVGYPTNIYVVLPNTPYQVAVGAVYTYYEFTVTPDQRMTDEGWRAQLEAGNAPALPDWTSEYIIP
jgi:hypothetical protein